MINHDKQMLLALHENISTRDNIEYLDFMYSLKISIRFLNPYLRFQYITMMLRRNIGGTHLFAYQQPLQANHILY